FGLPILKTRPHGDSTTGREATNRRQHRGERRGSRRGSPRNMNVQIITGQWMDIVQVMDHALYSRGQGFGAKKTRTF
ncbi:hypothetical protein, partial [Streptomyces sp. NPDC127119]|uniref:hypothetical protein n=1 Tax=Streptomyces sp. NPDC127119 TaxID=3345370 RepID=UPI003635A947